MRVLITAGPTYEPIDPVRFIGNRSSGRMGAAIAAAALDAGHSVTVIAGPISVELPLHARRINVETTAQMHEAVMTEFPRHDLLIMAAAVADYRPKLVHKDKIGRTGGLVIECEATEDIVAEAAASRRDNQRVIGFSLEREGNLERAEVKLKRKRLDLIVYNPLDTISNRDVRALLLWADGRSEELPVVSKEQFAKLLIERAGGLFESA
jgi:phosphopantothenoylcysteine decarboxylase / phosphopantothenate---cysteine ligase